MVENVQWIASSDCLPIVGTSVQFKQHKEGTAINDGIVLPDGTIEPFNAKGIFIHKYYWAELPEEQYMLPSLWKSDFRSSLQGIAIHCPTEVLDAKVIENAAILGFKYKSGLLFNKASYWYEKKEETCYNMYTGTYNSRKNQESEGSIIYRAEWFIKLTDSIIAQRNNFEDNIINCSTPEETNQLLTYANNLGFKWKGGGSFIERNNWARYTKDTCYSIATGTFGSRLWFEKDYTIISFRDFKAKYEKVNGLTREDLEKVGIQCTTFEELQKCCEIANNRGWHSEKGYKTEILEDVFSTFGEDSCIDFNNSNCNSVASFSKRGYEIKPAKWFLDKFAIS